MCVSTQTAIEIFDIPAKTLHKTLKTNHGLSNILITSNIP